MRSSGFPRLLVRNSKQELSYLISSSEFHLLILQIVTWEFRKTIELPWFVLTDLNFEKSVLAWTPTEILFVCFNTECFAAILNKISLYQKLKLFQMSEFQVTLKRGCYAIVQNWDISNLCFGVVEIPDKTPIPNPIKLFLQSKKKAGKSKLIEHKDAIKFHFFIILECVYLLKLNV